MRCGPRHICVVGQVANLTYEKQMPGWQLDLLPRSGAEEIRNAAKKEGPETWLGFRALRLLDYWSAVIRTPGIP